MLNISSRPAEGHKYEIMQALGVKTTAELVQQAIRLKLRDYCPPANVSYFRVSLTVFSTFTG